MEAAKRLQPFEELPTASDDLIREARDEYFRIAAQRTPLAPGKLLIDKNPLSMNLLPIIHRLFPEARIILALRHPCDVVFSCSCSQLQTERRHVEFPRLDTAAELYDLSFQLFRAGAGAARLSGALHRLRKCREGSRSGIAIADSSFWASSGTTPCSIMRPPLSAAAGSRPPAMRRSDNRSTARLPVDG